MQNSREILFCDTRNINRLATTATDPQTFGSSDFRRFDDHNDIPDNDHNNILDMVSEVMLSLSELERRVLRLRLGLEIGKPLTQKEVGQKIGYSPRSVGRFEKSALSKLRHPNS